jgi:hypothetical protein
MTAKDLRNPLKVARGLGSSQSVWSLVDTARHRCCARRVLSLVAIKFLAVLGALASVLAVLRIALTH